MTNFCFPMNFSHYWPFNILYCNFASFKNHIYFKNSVFLLCRLLLKSFLWYPNRCCRKSKISLFHYIFNICSIWGSALILKMTTIFYSTVAPIFGDFGLEQESIILYYYWRYILSDLLFFRKCFFNKLKNILYQCLLLY